jgi:hypothetical protein
MTLLTLLALISLGLAIGGMAKPTWNPYLIGTAVILLAICLLIGSHADKIL